MPPSQREGLLFIDDSQAVLDSAKAFGIACVVGITAPDSRGESRRLTGVPTIRDFSELTLP